MGATAEITTVACLGPEGTFSEQAARAVWGNDVVLRPQANFGAVFACVEAGQAQEGIVPYRNSTVGPVMENLRILGETNLTIRGERYEPVRHQLLTHAGDLTEITAVMAHPQALEQCSRWLADNVPQARHIPVLSNAEAAREAAKPQHRTAAAIAGVLAAHRYELPILSGNIQDDPDNTTRFVVIGKDAPDPTGNDKTTLTFAVPDHAEALAEALSCLEIGDINMTDLALVSDGTGNLGGCVFYADIEGHAADRHVAKALNLLGQIAAVKMLGSYPAERPIQKREQNESLDSRRARIDFLDSKIVALLIERALVAYQIGIIKGKGPKLDTGREEAVLARAASLAAGSLLSEAAIRGIFRPIIKACRELQEQQPGVQELIG